MITASKFQLTFTFTLITKQHRHFIKGIMTPIELTPSTYGTAAVWTIPILFRYNLQQQHQTPITQMSRNKLPTEGKKNPIRNIVLAHGFELTKNARIKLHKNGDLRRHTVYHHQFHTLEMECRWTMIAADEHPTITTHTTCVIIHIQNTVLHYLQVSSSIPFVKRS